MTSRAGATKAQMAPLWRDSQQLRREAGRHFSSRAACPFRLPRGPFVQGPLGQRGVTQGAAT